MSGFQFTEGPQWHDGRVLFTDIPANTIYEVPPGGAVTVAFQPSGNANGLAVDAVGRLFAAEHGTRRVSVRDGAMQTTVADAYDGKKLNSPNDVVVAGDGTVYFTDPPYGINDGQRELDFMGVFRVAANGTVTAEYRGGLAERPNGIGISPDGGRLYVADTSNGVVYRFAIGADGALGTREPHATTAGGADGLAVDEAGNLFVASSAGIEAFAPDGSRWGAIAVPMQPSNCAFGGADGRTLYITARQSVFSVQLANAGLPRN
jgi:gluconolactonase